MWKKIRYYRTLHFCGWNTWDTYHSVSDNMEISKLSKLKPCRSESYVYSKQDTDSISQSSQQTVVFCDIKKRLDVLCIWFSQDHQIGVGACVCVKPDSIHKGMHLKDNLSQENPWEKQYAENVHSRLSYFSILALGIFFLATHWQFLM